MARQVITTFIDDLDGDAAVRTVEFGVDGTAYTIDLSEANAERLRQALDPFIAAGRQVSKSRSRRPAVVATGNVRTAASRDENRAVREWAARNGHRVSERGRIPRSATEAYRAANGR